MSDLERAYKSLDNAKSNEQELMAKKERFDEIYDILIDYCLDYGFSTSRSITEKIESLRSNNKEQRLNIALALLADALGVGVVILISIFFLESIGIISVSIAGFFDFSIQSRKYFSAIFKNNKKIKALKGIEKSLSEDHKYDQKPLQELLTLVEEERETLVREVETIRGVIKEYEVVLDEANKALAEEVLAESGIEASVTMNSSMKVLAKRYETNE